MKVSFSLIFTLSCFQSFYASPEDYKGAGGSTFEGSQVQVGPPGPIGPPGVQGLRGYPGAQGLSGAVGPAGPSGNNGRDGRDGYRGPKGSKGNAGEKGDEGKPGREGRPARPGLNGKDGAPGAPGPPGLYVEGEKGQKGSSGQPGLNGSPGSPGERGLPGFPGYPGSGDGSTGATGQMGPKGDMGGIGWTGPQGGIGATGLQGIQGPPGQPGLAAANVSVNESKSDAQQDTTQDWKDLLIYISLLLHVITLAALTFLCSMMQKDRKMYTHFYKVKKIKGDFDNEYLQATGPGLKYSKDTDDLKQYDNIAYSDLSVRNLTIAPNPPDLPPHNVRRDNSYQDSNESTTDSVASRPPAHGDVRPPQAKQEVGPPGQTSDMNRHTYLDILVTEHEEETRSSSDAYEKIPADKSRCGSRTNSHKYQQLEKKAHNKASDDNDSGYQSIHGGDRKEHQYKSLKTKYEKKDVKSQKTNNSKTKS